MEYARSRFGVLDQVLATGNFKPVVSCQPGGGIGCKKIPFTALENQVDWVRALYMSLGSGQTFHVRITVSRSDGYQRVSDEIERMPSFADK